jgi:hypothetical protein
MADSTEPPAEHGPGAVRGRGSRRYRACTLLAFVCLCVGLLAAAAGAAAALAVSGGARPVVWALVTALVAIGAGVGWESRDFARKLQ